MKINKNELRKSLEDLDFSADEINDMISKAEKEGKLDDETIDEGAQKDGIVDEEEVKKAYEQIKSMKCELDKAIEVFFDKFGNIPGFTKPDDPFKSEKTDIEKSFGDGFEKAFNDKIDAISKGFENQNLVIDEIKKSLDEVSVTVQKMAEAPNPLKSLFGKYQFIEKGERTNEEGQVVVPLGNKKLVLDTFIKSLDKIEDEGDQQVVRNMISDFTISNKTNTTGLGIVKKAMNIEFEK